MSEKNTVGLYIHVPFCAKKCSYCDFYSLAGQKHDNYVKYVIKQAKSLSESCKNRVFDTVFLGGGTPTLLLSQSFRYLFSGIKSCFNVTEDAEISVEANPATIDENLLETLREIGVNRLSIGFQSAVDSELKQLSRIHSRTEFIESYFLARKAGFDNINIDLMYGIPSQTKESFFGSIREVIDLSPEHISMYGLKIEEGTPFFKARDTLPLPDENTEHDMYIEGINELQKHGYNQYEISNLSKSGKECRHNLKYWQGKEYVGLGPSAHSFLNGKRFSVIADLAKYKEFSGANEIYRNIEEQIEYDLITEYIMLRLRLTEGISLSEFKAKFDIDFLAKFKPIIQKYKNLNMLQISSDRLFLTLEGMYLSNYIISDLLCKI